MGPDVFATGSPCSWKVPGDPTASLDEIEWTVRADSSGLSYDASTGRYTYTWKTNKDWGGQTRRLVLKLEDGSKHKANFKFTK